MEGDRHTTQLHMTFTRAFVLGLGAGLGLLAAWGLLVIVLAVLIAAAAG